MKRLQSECLTNQNEISSTEFTQKDTSPTPPTPNLTVSRENTPYQDDPDLLRSGPNSEGGSSEDESTSLLNLDFSRAKLKRPLDATVKRDPKRKLIKGIEKLWVPLDQKTLASISELSKLSAKLVTELLKKSSNREAKTMEAHRILEAHWTSDANPKSFLARLKMTRLPLLKSLHVRARGPQDESPKVFDVKLTKTRLSIVEAQLNEELKELHKLDAYYKSVKALFEKDQKYLADLRASLATQQGQLQEDIKENMKKFGLHKNPLPTEHTKCIENPRKERIERLFNPNQDPDVCGLLQEVKTSLEGMEGGVFKMQEYLNHLNVIDQHMQGRRQK